MSSNSDTNESLEAKVFVMFDFEYSTDEGKVVRMKRGEQLRVVKKTNPDWWQCTRWPQEWHTDQECQSEQPKERPFYAPVCYLKKFDLSLKSGVSNKTDVNSNLNCNSNSDQKKNISTIKVGLSFTNPLSSGFSTDDNSEDEHRLNRSNGALDSSKESLIEDNNNCDNSSSQILDNSFSPSTSEGVYANLPMSSKSLFNRSLPPIPNSKASPIRILLDHWAEYKDSNGRKFYYNSLSRETSWKPPRRKPYLNCRDDELATSHSEENLTDSSTTSLSTTPNTSLLSDSPNFSPQLPKPKSRMWKKFVRNSNKTEISNESTTDETKSEVRSAQPSHSCPPTLPKGWTRKHNEETKELYFINNKTNEKV